MRFVIEAQGVKRELLGPFNVCASKPDFEALRDQLDLMLRDDFGYGWFTIWPKPQAARRDPDKGSPPIGWSET